METYTDISVIVCAYNAEKTIDRCIKSLLNQKINSTFRIIIVNDGSQDGTLNHLQKFRTTDRVFIIDKTNTGASDSRNVALDEVNSKYVTFVDSDDYVDPEYLNNMLAQYRDNPQIGLAISGYQKETKNGHKIMQAKGHAKLMTQRETLKNIFASYLIEGYLVNKLFKTSIICSNKLYFDPDIYIAEDLEFCCRYLGYVQFVSYNPEPTYHYIMHENSQLNSINIGKKFTERNLNLIQTLQKIQHQLCDSYPEVISAVNARICWAATVDLRAIYASPNRKTINSKIKNRLWDITKQYYSDFKKNDILPQRDKVIYWINRLMPRTLALIWKIVK